MNKLIVSGTGLIALLFLIAAGIAVGGKTVPSGHTRITSDVADSQTDTLTPILTSMAGEQIKRQVVSSGGNISSNGSYTFRGTLTQTAIGNASSASYSANQGFWQTVGSVSLCAAPGDANSSGGVDIDDVVWLIAYIFSGGPPPQPVLCCGDANGSGGVDIDDVVYLIAFIFSGGPAPIDDGCL